MIQYETAIHDQPRGDVYHAWSVAVAACQKSVAPLADAASRQRAFNGMRSKHAAKGLAPPTEEELASVLHRSAEAAAAASVGRFTARTRKAALREQLANDAAWQRHQHNQHTISTCIVYGTRVAPEHSGRSTRLSTPQRDASGRAAGVASSEAGLGFASRCSSSCSRAPVGRRAVSGIGVALWVDLRGKLRKAARRDRHGCPTWRGPQRGRVCDS